MIKILHKGKEILLHIGKKIPKGYKELPGGMHLGKGIWMFRIEKINETKDS